MGRGRQPVPEEQRRAARAIQTRLKERQEGIGMATEDLARASGINRRTLDKYFEGESPSPSFFLIAALARALRMSLDELAGDI